MEALKILLDIRKKEVDECSGKVSALNTQIEKSKKQVSTMMDYLLEVKTNASCRQPSKVTYGDAIVGHGIFIERIQTGINQQNNKIELLGRQLEFHQKKWQEAIIEKKKVEILIEQNEKKEKIKADRLEQKQNDEYCQRVMLSRED